MCLYAQFGVCGPCTVYAEATGIWVLWQTACEHDHAARLQAAPHTYESARTAVRPHDIEIILKVKYSFGTQQTPYGTKIYITCA